MTEPDSQPSSEQMEAFAKLTMEERFNWLTDLLQLMHDLTPPEIREKWRTNKARMK